MSIACVVANVAAATGAAQDSVTLPPGTRRPEMLRAFDEAEYRKIIA